MVEIVNTAAGIPIGLIEVADIFAMLATTKSLDIGVCDNFNHYVTEIVRYHFNRHRTIFRHPIKFCVNNNPSSNNKTADYGVIRLSSLSRKVCKFFKITKSYINALNQVLVFFNTGNDFFICRQLISDHCPILNLTAIPLFVKLGCA